MISSQKYKISIRTFHVNFLRTYTKLKYTIVHSDNTTKSTWGLVIPFSLKKHSYVYDVFQLLLYHKQAM